MQPCDAVAKHPFTFTHLMSPCYKERQLSHKLIYGVDYSFTYHRKKFVYARFHLLVLTVFEIRGGNFKHLKASTGMHKVMDVALLLHTVTYEPQTVVERQGHFYQMRGYHLYSENGLLPKRNSPRSRKELWEFTRTCVLQMLY